jgi:hypothetical protein
MKPYVMKTSTTYDRVATAEEILAAELPFPEAIEECDMELPCEIASDLGGYIRISSSELEMSLMVDEFVQEEDTRLN